MEARKAKRASRSKSRREKPADVVHPPFWRRHAVWTAVFAFTLAVAVFYWKPLADPDATPQWDTIDYHYSVQKFAAEELTSFRLPHWSEFSYSGFPFLADPQVGVWYPLNWPFFLAGITPKALQAEIALHVLLACIGCWLLARVWLANDWHAALAAVAYAFSGFFAGHASHLGMLQTAASLPLLLFGIHVSIQARSGGAMLLTGVGSACMFLAGHFQSALYTFAAMALYGAVVAAMGRRWAPAVQVLAACAALTVLLAAIQWVPTAELVGQSVRAGASFTEQTNAPLEARALWTLVSPNRYGSVRGNYTGPQDRTQFYFYAGIALLPLAAAGLARGRMRWIALALIAPFGWYAFGPAGGLYSLAARLPGLGSVRAPVHVWFVVALGLALLAGAGLSYVCAQVRFRWLAPLAVLAFFSDVYYWNVLENHLAYFRGSFQQRYGQFQDHFEGAVRRVLPAGARFHAPADSPAFGPLNHAYDIRVPVTYGSNPLPLRRYQTYMGVAAGNPNLLNALHVGAALVPETGAIQPNPAMLPKFWFPKSVTPVAPEQSAAALGSADPGAAVSMEGDAAGLNQDPAASVTQESASAERYVLRCRAGTPSLLRAAIPWYPAWRASVDGEPVATRILDHAMVGILVPAGEHRVVLEYYPSRFRLGAAISLATVAAVIALALLRRFRQAPGR